MTISAPARLLVSDLPAVGTEVTVRWSAGARGRLAAPSRVVSVRNGTLSTWVVEITGPVQVEQNRRFVRGGGGEVLDLERRGATGPGPVRGRVVDVSERSVRGRFTAIEIKAGDAAGIRMVLDDQVLDLSGSVLRVIENSDSPDVDVVAIFEPDEAEATAIRRYVMKLQMLERARTAR
jgi:hypothetical protein